jgi:hypothetical protein
MDVTGCPEGFATDKVFIANPVVLCDVNLAVFWSMVMLVCFIRLMAFALKTHSYVKVNGCRFVKRRSISMFVSVWSVLSYFLSSILVGVNVGNAANGWSFAFYSFTYLSFIVDFTMMLFKIVRLGKGVIALPKNQDMGNTDHLSKFTGIMMIIVFLQIALAVVSSITLIILSPIYPEQEYVFGTIGFASKGIFQILCTLVMVMVSFSFAKLNEAILQYQPLTRSYFLTYFENTAI